ncbi:hypothetical protein YC2023_101190 [Brassica napus]
MILEAQEISSTLAKTQPKWWKRRLQIAKEIISFVRWRKYWRILCSLSTLCVRSKFPYIKDEMKKNECSMIVKSKKGCIVDRPWLYDQTKDSSQISGTVCSPLLLVTTGVRVAR